MWEYKPQNKLIALQDRIRGHLLNSSHWHYFPLLLSAAMIFVIGVFHWETLHTRHPYPHSPIELSGEPSPANSIWLSLSLSEDGILIRTEDKKTIKLPRQLNDVRLLNPLSEYLNATVNDRIKYAALARNGLRDDLTAVLALEDSFRYAHIRPIIQALAAARIRHYAFETTNSVDEQPRKASN